MYNDCDIKFEDGRQVVDKIRKMGFSGMSVVAPLEIICIGCGHKFVIITMEYACPQCRMVYGVTPCQAHSADNVQPAGVGY